MHFNHPKVLCLAFLFRSFQIPLVIFVLWLMGLLLLSFSAHAQVPSHLQGRPISAVEIKGDAEGLVTQSSLEIQLGSALSRQYLRALTKRLLQSGRWSNIQIDAIPNQSGVILQILLVPKSQIGSLRIVGQEHLSKKEIQDVIQLSIGQDIQWKDLDPIRSSILELYQTKGFHQATASVRLRETSDPSKKALWISIDEGPQDQIQQITFIGDALPKQFHAFAQDHFQIGKKVTPSYFSEAALDLAKQMREKNYFEAFAKITQVSRNGHLLTAQVRLRLGPKYTLRFTGYPMIHPRTVERSLNIEKERLTESRLAFLKNTLEDLYSKYGYPDAEVTFQIETPQENEAVLNVHTQPGKRIIVSQISFIGNQFFSNSFLKEQITSFLNEELEAVTSSDAVLSDTNSRILGNDEHVFPIRKQMIQPLSPSRVYYEPAFERALKHVKKVYASDGFLQAQISEPQLQNIEDSKQDLPQSKVHIVIPIEEGPQTRIYSVQLVGENVLPQKQVLEAGNLKQDEPFSYAKLEEARRRIVDLYKEQGFSFVNIQTDLNLSGDQTRALITFSIFPRFKVQVSDFKIKGIEKTDPALILDLIPIEIGDVYRPSVSRKIQERLSQLGIFNSVSVSLQSPEIAARQKPLVITVSERPSQWIDFSAGVSTEQGVRSGFEYGYRNLFGYAMRFSFRAQLAYQFFFLDQEYEDRLSRLSLLDRLERQISLSFIIPHFPSIPDVIGAVNLVHQRENERAFGLDKIGAGISATWKPLKWFSLLFSEDFELNDVDLFVDNSLEGLIQITNDARLLRLLRVPEGRTMVVATSATSVFDFRDNIFSPTEGFFTSVFTEWTHTLFEQESDSNFFSNHLKISTTINGYIPFLDRFVLALQAKTGGIIHLQNRSETYPNRLFFLGGIDSVRGYLEDTLIPQDLADEIQRNPNLGPRDVVPGGDSFFLVRAELRARIQGSFYLGVFSDFGNLWADASKYNPIDLRPTAGLGLRIATPVGPIALDYGFLLLRRKSLGEPFGNFHFSIGLF